MALRGAMTPDQAPKGDSPTAQPSLRRFPDAASQAAAVADDLAATLRQGIAERGSASLVLSGGRTPELMLAMLATRPLPWAQVQITLVDERYVAVSDPASNEHLIRTRLLRDAAGAAQFYGLMSEAQDAPAAAAAAWKRLANIRRPFDVVVLGMGEDGHFASLMPGSAELHAALTEDADPTCIATHPPLAPYERLSLNLPAVLQARSVRLQINGAAKWALYQRALAPGDREELPIRAVLRQSRVPVAVYWSS
jgi:6-phosphogluconolactonase